jgi:dual specificity MAP kinase phosphatase
MSWSSAIALTLLQPIYATLSDIVIYSPLGLTPNALRLADLFKGAVERKWSERVDQRAAAQKQTYKEMRKGKAVDKADVMMGDPGEGVECVDEEGLVKYNVFVLDADGEEVRKIMPDSVIRMDGEEGDESGEFRC